MLEQKKFHLKTTVEDSENQILPTDQTVNEINLSKAQVLTDTKRRRLRVDNELVELVVLPPVMTEAEARQCLSGIRERWTSIRALVLELKERRGWEALGYSNLTACLEAEFSESRTKLVRELKAAEVEKHILQVPIGTWSASHFRPLSQLKPEQYKPALDKARELAGDEKLTAAHVAKAVRQTIAPTQFLTLVAETPNYQPGELVRVQCPAKALQAQKKWDGCWGIVQSSDVHVRLLVGGQKVDYEPANLTKDENLDVQYYQTCERILALWQTKLEAIEQAVLKELQQRRSFTELEIQMICLMETKLFSSR